MKLKYLFLAAPLLLVACSGSRMPSFNVPNPFEAIAPSGPEVTMQLENGAQVKFVVTTTNTQLAQFVRVMTERGYYDDQYIYRDVPGAFVLTGKARLSNRPTVAGPYVPKETLDKLGDVGTGEVGLVTHVDGTVGPEFILRYGMMIRDQETQPANVKIGVITAGKEALEAAEKGDKVTKVTIIRQPQPGAAK